MKTNHLTDKELVHKEILHINKKKINNPIEKETKKIK